MTDAKRVDTSSAKLVLVTSKPKEYDDIEIQNNEKETIYNLKQKYKDAVLFEIYEDEKILHSTLANRISISASGMNAVIKKLNEVKTPPICIEKQGKFTFYSLEEAGKKYVQDVLLPSTVSEAQNGKRVHNIFNLLSVFKDQNPKKWMHTLPEILTNKVSEEFEEGCGFIKELGAYYFEASEYAENLLSLAVVDKELQKRILDYIKKNSSRNFENAWEVLDYWLQENCFEVYRLIDCLFETVIRDNDLPDDSVFELTDVAKYMDVVLNKIQAGLLRVLVRKIPKWDAAKMWVKNGMDKNLAIYIAEKYATYCLEYGKIIVERELCV